MKKITALVVLAALAFGLAGCEVPKTARERMMAECVSAGGSFSVDFWGHETCDMGADR